MLVSLMKKGSKALALTLLSLCLSVGSSGLASAHSSASQASFQGGPGVYVNPETVKETTNGTGGFVLYGHHLSSMTPYTVTSADLGGASCPLTLPTTLPITEVTDIEGNFVQPFSFGTTSAITTATINNIIIAYSSGGTTNVDITIPNPFSGGGTIAFTIPNSFTTTTVTIPNPFGDGGTTTATATIIMNPTTIIITIPNPAGGGGTITITNAVIGTNSGTVTTTGVPCIPNTYHLSVQQLTTHALYNASVTIAA